MLSLSTQAMEIDYFFISDTQRDYDNHDWKGTKLCYVRMVYVLSHKVIFIKSVTRLIFEP